MQVVQETLQRATSNCLLHFCTTVCHIRQSDFDMLDDVELPHEPVRCK